MSDIFAMIPELDVYVNYDQYIHELQDLIASCNNVQTLLTFNRQTLPSLYANANIGLNNSGLQVLTPMNMGNDETDLNFDDQENDNQNDENYNDINDTVSTINENNVNNTNNIVSNWLNISE